MKRLKLLNSSKESSKHFRLLTPRKYAQAHKADLILLGCVVLLSFFGLLMVYDASQFEAFQDMGDKFYFIKQQVVWAALGFLSLGFFSFFDYHRLQKFTVPVFLFSVLLLLLVFIPGLGVSVGGANRWLRIAGLTIQPTEIIKISAAVFFATYFQKRVQTWPFLIILGAIGFIIGIFQKDLGSAVVFSMIALGIYFAAGAPIKIFLGLLPLGVLTFIGFVITSGYRKQRVLAFLDPFADPQGFSYHISQVLIALGSGGFFGLGIGQSRQKFAYIPEVTTDSIFSVIGEEFGFVGSVILVSLIAYLILRGFKIAEKASDDFGKLLAVGLVTWLGAQTVVNLAAMVSLMPLTGVPLPFISYGGSALLANLVAVGILINISKHSVS